MKRTRILFVAWWLTLTDKLSWRHALVYYPHEGTLMPSHAAAAAAAGRWWPMKCQSRVRLIASVAVYQQMPHSCLTEQLLILKRPPTAGGSEADAHRSWWHHAATIVRVVCCMHSTRYTGIERSQVNRAMTVLIRSDVNRVDQLVTLFV